MTTLRSRCGGIKTKVNKLLLSIGLISTILFKVAANDTLPVATSMKFPAVLIQSIDCFFDESKIDSTYIYAVQTKNQSNDKVITTLSELLMVASICENGRYQEATMLFNQMDHLFCEKNSVLVPWYNLVKGMLFYRTDSWAESYRYLLESLNPNYATSDKRIHALSSRLLGRICMNMGDFSKAIEWLDESTRIFMKLKLEKSVFINYKTIGRYYTLSGEHAKSLPYFKNALEGLKSQNDTLQFFYVYVNLVDYYLNQNELNTAQEYSDTCVYLSRLYDNNFVKSQTLINEGEIALQQKKYDLANKIFTKTIELARDIDDNRIQLVSRLNLSSR